MKRFIKLLLFAGVTMSLSSCLKDKGYESNLYGINDSLEDNKVVNIPTTGTTFTVAGTYPLAVTPATTPATFLPATTPVTITIPVHLSAKDPASEELNVTLAGDATDAKITAYNATITSNPKFIRLPADKYTLSNAGVAKIAAGGRDASVTLTFVPATLTSGVRYALPVVISSVDKSGYIISGNQGYRMFLITIR
ncbi:DUF1735 domain-containing protein [Pedobacter sp. D749]|uniref:DUF1735 domain-containing protein n=1 Tax=Pedobacter sp. D749 TaxID=2856523 RepID=UPI001C59BFB3|nr:DUF1735 domain-containing protein [Pedobacter sp. D749]QXU41425.1 DUF1735 domain-containing protein [Pedobacter sp. D749]